MNAELMKILAPYFTSIMGAVVAIGIAVYNNTNKSKAIQNRLSGVDHELGNIQNKISNVDNKISGVDQELGNIQNKIANVDNKVSDVDHELHELKSNHFFHLGEYLKKLNAFIYRGKLMDEVEKADMDLLADGVGGKK